MYAARKLFLQAGVHRAMSLQKRLSRKILADEHDAKVRFGPRTTLVPCTLIQNIYMKGIKRGLQPLHYSLTRVHECNGTPRRRSTREIVWLGHKHMTHATGRRLRVVAQCLVNAH